MSKRSEKFPQKSQLKQYKIGSCMLVSGAINPGLYIVSTPIGNLSDITLRALEVLAGVDMVACEDKRVTIRLMKHYAINQSLVSYHEYNARKSAAHLCEKLLEGKSVALVSDAGTPLISDPGYRLVGAAIDLGIDVIPIPGVCAAVTALSIAGLPTDRFLFAGFLPVKYGKRRKKLRMLAQVSATLVFYESAKRLTSCLQHIVEEFGGSRNGAICREITKLHETILRGTLEELILDLGSKAVLKGEIVIVISPPAQEDIKKNNVEETLSKLLTSFPATKAASEAAKLTGISKRELYQYALTLKKTKNAF